MNNRTNASDIIKEISESSQRFKESEFYKSGANELNLLTLEQKENLFKTVGIEGLTLRELLSERKTMKSEIDKISKFNLIAKKKMNERYAVINTAIVTLATYFKIAVYGLNPFCYENRDGVSKFMGLKSVLQLNSGSAEESVILNVILIELLSNHYNKDNLAEELLEEADSLQGIDFKNDELIFSTVFQATRCKYLGRLNNKLSQVNPSSRKEHELTLHELFQAVKVVQLTITDYFDKKIIIEDKIINQESICVERINNGKVQVIDHFNYAKELFVTKIIEKQQSVFLNPMKEIDCSVMDFATAISMLQR